MSSCLCVTEYPAPIRRAICIFQGKVDYPNRFDRLVDCMCRNGRHDSLQSIMKSASSFEENILREEFLLKAVHHLK